MIMPKRDNNAPPLSEGWEGPFHDFLVQKRLVPEDKANYFVHAVVGRDRQTIEGNCQAGFRCPVKGSFSGHLPPHSTLRLTSPSNQSEIAISEIKTPKCHQKWGS
jgi:hypothetical protein